MLLLCFTLELIPHQPAISQYPHLYSGSFTVFLSHQLMPLLIQPYLYLFTNGYNATISSVIPLQFHHPELHYSHKCQCQGALLLTILLALLNVIGLKTWWTSGLSDQKNWAMDSDASKLSILGRLVVGVVNRNFGSSHVCVCKNCDCSPWSHPDWRNWKTQLQFL